MERRGLSLTLQGALVPEPVPAGWDIAARTRDWDRYEVQIAVGWEVLKVMFFRHASFVIGHHSRYGSAGGRDRP